MSLGALLAAGGLMAPQQTRAASQTWSNAPVDNTWTNVNNWVGKAVPGDVNINSANTVNGDTATFNAPLLGGIGGAGNPILPDDATVVGRSRRILGVTFDTTNCGPYVIYSPSPVVVSDGTTIASGILYVCHNGAIRINDSVTNSQAVIIPLYVNLPSSTAGIFNLVNNSTNPGVSLTINSVTHAGATTRATTFILDGTNSSVNYVTNLSEGPGNGTGGFTKQGTNTWVIAGPGTFPAASPLNINAGTLAVQDPNAFGLATTAIVTNGTLRIDGVALTTSTFSLRNGGTIRMNGINVVKGVNVNNIAGNNCTLATTSASDVMTVGDGTVANQVTGGAIDSVVHIAGPGVVLLSQPGNYIGKWSVDSGTNQISFSGALGTGPNLNVSAGGVFDITPMGPGALYVLDTKAFSANGTGTAVGSTAADISADPTGTVDFASKPITLTFTPTSFTGDTGHPALFCSRGILAFHGNAITVNNASGTPLGLGTYQLVQQASGNISSSGGFVTLMQGSGLVPGAIAEINQVGGNLNLVVSAYTPKPLVWSGNDPVTPGNWDRQITANWLSGATPSTFNIYDSVTFNTTGSAHPTVNLTAVMQPSTLVVDTSANDYTFSGPGQVAGGTSLVKINTGGTLNLLTANTYSGGTIISNGTVKLGIDEGISSTAPAGQNDVLLLSPAVFDLNNFSNTVNGLSGSGTIDITGGAVSTLNIGFNGDGGTFTGPIKNSSGVLGITKLGSGLEVLTASNSYVGPTVIDTGTLRVTNVNALGSGQSAVTINSGTLDMQTSLIVSNLNGGGGLVINSSTFTNILSIQNNSTIGALISGKIGLLINAGTTRLNAANTYSNGTIIAANAGLAIGGGAANPGPGMVIASNNVAFSQPNTASGSSTFAPPITTVDGATVTFSSASTANNWGNQFIGSALATDVFSNGNMSIGGALSFSNFLGTVIITNGGVRWFNAAAGGDNTTFIFQGPTGGCFARDAVDVIHLGALFGNGVITGPSVSWPATYWIGGKGNDSEYSGAILGSNNIVKVGAGKLLLDGVTATVLASDNATFTNYQYASSLTNFGTFTVSNGVLAVASPNDFSAASGIFVASPTALLDATSMGYVTNFNDNNSQPTSAVITNGILTIVQTTVPGGSQTLGGNGPVKANGFVNMGTINPGFTGVAGTLTLSNTLQVMANATNFFDLSDDPSGLTAPSDVLRVQGNIGLTGTSIIGLGAVNGTINPGTYSLIKYSGSLTNETGIVPSGPVSNFQLGGAIPATTRATLQLANASGEVDLTVVSLNTSNLTWVGGVDPITSQTTNLWDVVTSYSWTNSGSGTPMQFFQLDNVSFTDLSTNQVVFLQGGLAPSSITVNSASNYIFGGTGNIIGDTAITKSGTGNLTLTNGANTFNGGITINSGIVKAGSESANNQNDLALGVGPVTVKTGGELRLGGGGTTLHFVTNTVTINGGALRATDGVQHLTNSTVTIGASGGTLETMFSTKNLVLDSPLNGAGNLTVPSGTNIAAGQVILNNPTNGLTGNVVIATNGNLAFAGFASVSNSPSIDVQQGGILDVLGRSNSTWAAASGQTILGNGAIRGKFLTVSAGSTIAPGIAGAIGTLTVTNSASGTNWTVLTLSGTVNMDISRGALPNNSDRIVNVNGTNVFGGTLNVNNIGGTLQAGDTFTLFTSAVNNGAFTTVNLPALTGSLTWNNTLTANGKISVVGSTILPTVSPGITNFSLAGANIVLNGTNSQVGATYYLLSTTNVSLPVSQWKTIATNVAAGTTYSFTGTNAVTAGQPQQFYLLSSTNYNP